MAISDLDMFLRMGAAAGLGAAIGSERQWTGRPAGLRTHLLVALASATFMLVSTQFVYYQHYGRDDLVMVDTSRIAASVVAGVGFLGAGVVLRTGGGIKGITTAASVWLVAAIGLAAGGGMYAVAAATTGVSLFTLVVLGHLKRRVRSLVSRRMVILLKETGRNRAEVLQRIEACGAVVAGVDEDHNLRRKRCRLTLDVQAPDGLAVEAALVRLAELPYVLRVKVHRPVE